MRKLVFLTGTRADFGKIKPLLSVLNGHPDFELHLFVTGMHLLERYGYTLLEVQRAGLGSIHTFENFTSESTMDLTLAKTIEGFSSFIRSIQPDMICVHGDRVEALAGAIVGSLNNIIVGHIEGGELSGTIDDLIRHSVSKLSHLHFVANDQARLRLLQMGESETNVHVIGSPDIDVMLSDDLPKLKDALSYYDIPFKSYAISLFHPVTTEHEQLKHHLSAYHNALESSGLNWIVIYPNNDLGSELIIQRIEKLRENPKFRVLPSLRFEYFLTLLKHAIMVAGNSSAGIREAPFYGVPSLNVGSRQQNRSTSKSVRHISNDEVHILNAINGLNYSERSEPSYEFGDGRSAVRFMDVLNEPSTWKVSLQKPFVDVS